MEKTIREMAATTELPPELPPHWFLHLLNRIDSVESNLRSELHQEIGSVRQEIGSVRQEISGVYRWSIGLLATMLLGFSGVIVTLIIALR